jgi:putative component of toxin-antitoxin plasmid stabilization module
VQGADRLRELRPRAGRSPWRAFYRQMGDVIFVVGAVGPEAAVKPRDFARAIRVAEERLNEIEKEEDW